MHRAGAARDGKESSLTMLKLANVPAMPAGDNDLPDYEWQHAKQIIDAARQPSLSLLTAVVYDIETFPNCFTLTMRTLYGDTLATWEISPFRDDRRDLITWFNHLRQTQTVMIGFNNIGFDYPVIHYIFTNPNCTVEQIYAKAMSIINGFDNRFAHIVWERDRFAPQLDLYKIYHFDNKAKTTNLKALQINMRAETVVDMPIENGTVLTKQQIDELLVPYNVHDVDETKRFALHSLDAINFRMSLIPIFGVDVLNWADTKIGSRMIESRLGDDLCFDRSSGRKVPRQTPRGRIALADIIFPYVGFNNPEFQRVHSYLHGYTLTAQDVAEMGNDDAPAKVQTKGVFTDLKAMVGGLEFGFGVGGIHASVSSQRIVATDEWLIRDIDVKGMYPDLAIQNEVAPAHLGKPFLTEYKKLPIERGEWQKKKGKKCNEANTIKLGQNGVYGNSNNAFSCFYDPQYTMTITVNGQLSIAQLAEWLLTVPTLRIIQANTDGITYFIHRDHEPHAAHICREWEKLTKLTLEDANYKRMWVRDVNNYVAEDMKGELKLKGAYWSPDPLDYHASIANAQPPAWHKDLGGCVVIRAAVAAMVHGLDPETFIRMTRNPFDFMNRIKVGRADILTVGGQQVQRNTRYYVSTNGQPMVKTAPPPVGKKLGAFKKKNGVSDAEYNRVMNETGWQWDARVNTGQVGKPKTWGVYDNRNTAIEAGFNVTVCNDVKNFDFSTVNYDWYINEARKLIIV